VSDTESPEPAQVAEPIACEHHWASEHKPGHLLYWIRQCQHCHAVDSDDLDQQVRELPRWSPRFSGVRPEHWAPRAWN
jgi:hypothetical protein